MRKLISATLCGVVVASAVGITGCTDSTGTQETTKITTPTGTATETKSNKIEKTGNNPPAAPSEKAP
jgi:hypothetical protein